MQLAAQSPWTRAKNDGYAQVGFSMIPAYSSVFFDGDQSYEIPRQVTDVDLQLYGEYGVLEGTTAVLSLPIKVVSTGDLNPTYISIISPSQEKTLVGLGNVTLGVRQAILKQDFKLSAYLNADLPLISKDDASGLQTGFDAFLITPGISFGAGLGKGYAYGYSGVQIATSNISHSYLGGIEVGYNLFDIVTAAVAFNARISFENIDDTFEPNVFTGLYMNNQEYMSIGFKFFKEFKNGYGASAAFYGAFSASNVARAPSFNVGVFKKFEQESTNE